MPRSRFLLVRTLPTHRSFRRSVLRPFSDRPITPIMRDGLIRRSPSLWCRVTREREREREGSLQQFLARHRFAFETLHWTHSLLLFPLSRFSRWFDTPAYALPASQLHRTHVVSEGQIYSPASSGATLAFGTVLWFPRLAIYNKWGRAKMKRARDALMVEVFYGTHRLRARFLALITS